MSDGDTERNNIIDPGEVPAWRNAPRVRQEYADKPFSPANIMGIKRWNGRKRLAALASRRRFG